MAKTLAEKVWESHVVARAEGEPDLLHRPASSTRSRVHRHLTVCAQQTGRCVAGPDHGDGGPQRSDPWISTSQSPTRSRALRLRHCVATALEFEVPLFSLGNVEQGIVHVVGPQLVSHNPA